jgi:hypothetical protein
VKKKKDYSSNKKRLHEFANSSVKQRKLARERRKSADGRKRQLD